MHREWWIPPTEDEMRALLKRMTKIRLLETEVMKGGEDVAIHSCGGHEAAALGVISQLRNEPGSPCDLIVSNHRAIGHLLAKAGDHENIVGMVFAELMGRETGVCQGLGGEMHWSLPERGFLASSMIIAACLGLGTGAALSLKRGRVVWEEGRFVNTGEPTDQIAVAFHGDATSGNGAWHEALTMAKTLQLPLLAVCENNYLDANVPGGVYLPTETVAQQAIGLGIPASVCDGTDILSVLEAAQRAIAYVREKRTPFFLEAQVVRLFRHKIPRMGDARPPEVKRAARMRDPLLKLKSALIVEGLWSEAQDQDMRGEIELEIREAIEFAKASPLNPRSPKAIQVSMLEERAKASRPAVRP